MTDTEQTIALITKSPGRKSVFHFTRASNLQAMAHFDTLWSSHRMLPDTMGERRTSKKEVFLEGTSITVNAHLRIPAAVMETNCTVEEFRAFHREEVEPELRRNCFGEQSFPCSRGPIKQNAGSLANTIGKKLWVSKW